MWPFTSRRIFASRWWALGFVVFVCWQAVDFAGDQPGAAPSQADNEQAMRAVSGALNAM